MNDFMPCQAFLKGQQNTAHIWSRNIAPAATAAISIGPNDMGASVHENKGNANA